MRTFMRNFVDVTFADRESATTCTAMNDITDLFQDLITQIGSVDVAEAEFKRMVGDDADLRAQYRQWCSDNDTTERRGFADFCQQWLDEQASIWDNLKDYDEQ